MNRRGRKSKSGPRHDCGKLIQSCEPREPAILDMTIDRRADLVGTANAKLPEAGYALGQLLLKGRVSQRQHDAGRKLEDIWRRWASLAGLPDHHPHAPAGGGQAPDTDPEAWMRAKNAFNAAEAVLRAQRQAPLVWTVIESIVMDGILPPSMLDGWAPPATWSALTRGLDALAQHFGVPNERAA